MTKAKQRCKDCAYCRTRVNMCFCIGSPLEVVLDVITLRQAKKKNNCGRFKKRGEIK